MCIGQRGCKIIYLCHDMKKALITWVTGQDWSYLAELLLEKGYEVHAIKRRSSSFNTDRIDHFYQDPHIDDYRFKLHYGDMTDSANMNYLIWSIQPDEVYNLAAQSHVKVSFEIPEYTWNADAIGALRILEAIRSNNLTQKTKFYQASTSEMYGGMWYNMPETWYTEQSPFHPRSPYGAAKLYAHRITVNYRESYGIFACSGILFNHESPRRGETFVTRKITRWLCSIALWLQDCLYLWNLDAMRDRWHAKEYVEWMRMMLQHHTPDDYVLATWITTSIRAFVELVAKEVGMDIVRSWEAENEIGVDRISGKTVIKIDPKYYRPAEVAVLLWDASKAKAVLWREAKISLEELARDMVAEDFKIAAEYTLLQQNWHHWLSQETRIRGKNFVIWENANINS